MQNKKDLYRKLVREEELTLEEIEFLGDTSKANLDLPFKYVIRGDKFFCSRNTNLPNLAPICSPNNNLIAKIGNYQTQRTKDIQNLEEEYRIHKQVYNCGIKIPQPKGLYNIYDVSKRKFQKAIVMEKIDGMTLASYCLKVGPNSPACKEITQHWKKDSEKFGKQFDLKDNSSSNVIVDKDQKIHFIDPEFWSQNAFWEKREPVNWFQKLLRYLDL